MNLNKNFGWMMCSAAMAALSVLSPQALQAQVKAPRYTGNVEAPTQQVILPPLPPALTPHGTVVEDVVVQVNDQIITRSDVERAYSQLEQEGAREHATGPQFADMQKNVLRDMIDQQLLLSRAKELGLNADADVIRQLDELRKRNNMASLDDLEKAARAQGLSYDDLKAQIKNQILTQQVVREEVGRHLQMSEGEENKYYNAHKADFEQPEQVKLSEILVPLSDTATQADIAQAEIKANAIKSQIMQGGDFAEIAKKMSGGPSAAQGGELGMFKRGQLAKVLEDQTFSLKPGESTQPIRTRQGFVILKVMQHDMAGPAPLKDVEPQVQEAMYMEQMQPALRVYLTKLRQDSYVDIAPGFVDSGATGSESKLINTAYAPPPVKKKVVKAKSRYETQRELAAANRKVIASPDTTGSRTLTGADAAVDQNTGMAVISPKSTVIAKNGKIRKEKIRFGQAPRTVLGPDDGTETATSTAGPATPAAAAPANELASNESANLADNPLAPKAPELKKTRFASRAKEEKEKKTRALTAKSAEKALNKPQPPSATEKATEKIQAAPLSVTGTDEAKKAPKPKRQKGEAKARLEDKPATPAAAKPVVEQTANPALAPTSDTPPTRKTTDKPSSDQTTLPGVNNPPPNTPSTTGQPAPNVPPPPPSL